MNAQQRSDASMQYAVPAEFPEIQSNNPKNLIVDDSKTNAGATAEISRELRREFRWFEVGSLLVNIVLAAVGIVAVYIYGSQLKVMQGHLDQMRVSADQSENLIREAIRQNSMAQSALELNPTQAKLSREQMINDQSALVSLRTSFCLDCV